MSDKKRGLGRGLEALLGEAKPRPEPGTPPAREQLMQIPVDLLSRGKYQPRVDMREESLQELADSIKAQGVIQPIVVRPVGAPDQGAPQRYEIVAGERRWRAAQMAGLHEIPAVLRRIDDEHAVALALIENIQREDLNPLEEALALSRLIGEFHLTHQQAAEAVGNLLGLLIGWLYFAILESSPWQATLGKKALGLVVTDQLGQRIGFGRATGRYFAKILSALILLIGFIMVAFTERKQGLHDLIAGTFVVRGQPGNIDVSAFE